MYGYVYEGVYTTEDFIESKEIYEVLEPDDRQPGWRNRSYLASMI